jgi:hypothetical protein
MEVVPVHTLILEIVHDGSVEVPAVEVTGKIAQIKTRNSLRNHQLDLPGVACVIPPTACMRLRTITLVPSIIVHIERGKLVSRRIGQRVASGAIIAAEHVQSVVLFLATNCEEVVVREQLCATEIFQNDQQFVQPAGC